MPATPTARLPASGLRASLACSLHIEEVIACPAISPDSITLSATVARIRVPSRCAGLSGCAPCRLRCHGHAASIPHAFAPSRLRRCVLRLPILLRGSLPQWQCPGYAPACCGRLCESVPSTTLAVQRNHVTKDSSPGLASMELPHHSSSMCPRAAVGTL